MTGDGSRLDRVQIVFLDVAAGDVRLVDGEVLDSVRVVDHGSPDDPRTWTSAVDSLSVAGDGSVAIRASEVGLICLDADGVPLHPILWAHDQCSRDDATWCRKKYDDDWWMTETHVVPEARHVVTKLSWMHRSHPDLWDRTRRFCSLEDHVRHHVTQESDQSPIISRSEEFAAWGVGSPSRAVLQLIDGGRDWTSALPAVGEEGALLGRWRSRDVVL